MSNCKNTNYNDDNDDCESKCQETKPCHEVVSKCNRKSALEAVSVGNKTVAAGLAVQFDTNLVTEGNAIIHAPSGTDFNLIAPGIYRVTFTGTVTPTTTGTASVALAINGSVVQATTVSQTVAPGTHAALATQLLVQVSPFLSTVVTVVNPTTDTEIFTNPNIIIEKIG